MAKIKLPFSLESPDANNPVTTTTEIYDTALGKSQAELNQLIGQGGGGSSCDTDSITYAQALSILNGTF